MGKKQLPDYLKQWAKIRAYRRLGHNPPPSDWKIKEYHGATCEEAVNLIRGKLTELGCKADADEMPEYDSNDARWKDFVTRMKNELAPECSHGKSCGGHESEGQADMHMDMDMGLGTLVAPGREGEPWPPDTIDRRKRP